MGRGEQSRTFDAVFGAGRNTHARQQPAERLPGELLSVEGLDGAGKSTVIERLREKFDDGASWLVLREPGGTPLSELLRNVLKGEPLRFAPAHRIGSRARGLLTEAAAKTENQALREMIGALLSGRELPERIEGELSAMDELLLFNAARAQLVDEVVRPALAEGRTVLLDRFIDSTVAYQGGGRGLDLDQVREICTRSTGGIVPDKTLYLRVSPEVRAERIGGRGPEDRIEAAGNQFFLRVAETFELMAEREPERVRVIDADLAPDQVAEQALRATSGERVIAWHGQYLNDAREQLASAHEAGSAEAEIAGSPGHWAIIRARREDDPPEGLIRYCTRCARLRREAERALAA